jgi:predicted short-subunit dehydrogenase-like oxidoreductase (DUF2520 family)
VSVGDQALVTGPDQVVILGRGRVGNSLALALDAAGLRQMLLPARPATAFAAALGFADVVFLAVPDEAIETTADAVAGALDEGCAPAVVHLSGAVGLDVLSPVTAHGCPTGSFHPFRPFADVCPPEALVGTTVGFDASDAAIAAKLVTLAGAIGTHPRHVPEEQRVLYHAAAVTASASVVALASQATDLLCQLGWSQGDALAALMPLMQGAVDNLVNEGLPKALTGPWRRGDADTVESHVGALGAIERPLTLAAYLALAGQAVDLARGIGLDETGCQRLRTALDVAH